MNDSRAYGRKTDAELSRVLGVSARHKSGRFFVPYLYEPNFVRTLAQSFHDAVNSVARKAEHDVHAPKGERIDQNVCSVHLHGIPPVDLRSRRKKQSIRELLLQESRQ